MNQGHLYKQSVEYCYGSLSSSLVNTQLVFLLDISPVRFTCSDAIELCIQWLPQHYIIEGVLSMEYEDGRWRLVAYFSKLLNKIEHNYEIYDKEMLAMIKGLENQIKECKVSV